MLQCNIHCISLYILVNEYIYFQKPKTVEEWKKVSEGFAARWNFPHCVGSLDGKHIRIQAPDASGSLYFNYKGCHSIVMMVLADSNYRVIYADVGCQGRLNDGKVFSFTSFSNDLVTGNVSLPPHEPLPGRNYNVPYVIVADDAFALSEHIMKPYKGQYPGSGNPIRIFNYRLSRARRIVENVFGIMASKFRVFQTTIVLHPDKVESVALACMYLHNFLRRNVVAVNGYTPPGNIDYEDPDSGNIVLGSWRTEVNADEGMFNLQCVARRPSSKAERIRDEFKDYFMSPTGAIPWQNAYA